MRLVALLILLSACPSFGVQSTEDDKQDRRYNAVLWTQVSPEYEVAVRQVYRMARLQLTAGLADANHSADEVQRASKDYSEKPPAIILDVDETVLDNSAYNARNIQDRGEFASPTWDAWVDEATAPAVPGAIEFVEFAQSKGVKVFMVSNRRDKHVEPTKANLKRLGLDLPASQFLFRNDDKGRGGSKVSRRAMVAQNHRIVLLIGDNIADLCVGGEDPQVSREKLKTFGDGWVMIPNAMYGSWERNGRVLRTQRTVRPRVATSPATATPATAATPSVLQPATSTAPMQVQPRVIYVMPNCCCPCCRRRR